MKSSFFSLLVMWTVGSTERFINYNQMLSLLLRSILWTLYSDVSVAKYFLQFNFTTCWIDQRANWSNIGNELALHEGSWQHPLVCWFTKECTNVCIICCINTLIIIVWKLAHSMRWRKKTLLSSNSRKTCLIPRSSLNDGESTLEEEHACRVWDHAEN
jgi:hypothetical protein